MTLVDDLVEGLADVTLIDEHTKSILMVNKEILTNMTMHVAPPGGQISY